MICVCGHEKEYHKYNYICVANRFTRHSWCECMQFRPVITLHIKGVINDV